MIEVNNNVRIYDLNNHLEHIPLLAKWHHQQFKNSGADREVLILARTGENDIPKTFIARLGEMPIGFVCLIENNATSMPELTPWLASLYVQPEHRSKGVGQALIERCITHTSEAGFSKLHLYTSSAVDFYKKLGWQQLGNFSIMGKTEIILAKSC